MEGQRAAPWSLLRVTSPQPVDFPTHPTQEGGRIEVLSGIIDVQMLLG